MNGRLLNGVLLCNKCDHIDYLKSRGYRDCVHCGGKMTFHFHVNVHDFTFSEFCRQCKHHNQGNLFPETDSDDDDDEKSDIE
jgi:hypothetical protein